MNMPILSEGKRFLTETLAGRINEMVFGLDGSVATEEDGGAGRPAIVVTPTVRVIDDTTISVEGSLGTSTNLALNIKEVALQYRNPSDTTEVIPLYRYAFKPFSKTSRNEIKFSVLIEVD